MKNYIMIDYNIGDKVVVISSCESQGKIGTVEKFFLYRDGSYDVKVKFGDYDIREYKPYSLSLVKNDDVEK